MAAMNYMGARSPGAPKQGRGVLPWAQAGAPQFVQNIQAEQAANPMGPNQPQQPVPRPVSEQGGAQTWQGIKPAATAPRADGLDQRAIDADPAGFAQWQKDKAAAAAVPAAPAPAGALAGWATNPSAMTSADLATIAGPTQGPTAYKPDDSALVSKQLAALLSQDSPYITRARTKAAQYANRRGLSNSSMAAGAGEVAAIDAALPIASADAGTFFTAQRDNANAENTFARDANAFGRQGALAITNAGFQAGRDEADRAFTTGRDATQFQNRLTEIGAQTDAQIRLLDKQAGTNLYTAYRNSSQQINDDYASAAQRINESDMDPDVKQTQIAGLQELTAQRQTFLNTIYAESPQWTAEWAQFAVEPAAGG